MLNYAINPPINPPINSPINPKLLRQFWTVVETTQTNLLLNLDDPELVQQLALDLATQQHLGLDEAQVVNHYIQSKLPLIRDIAQSRIQSRLVPGPGLTLRAAI
jgi:hypothetical protein